MMLWEYQSAICIVLWFGPLLPCPTAEAVVTSDGPGTHVVSPGQAMFGLDLDGVALIAGELPDAQNVGDLLPLCSGALISDFHVLSAAHCYDEDRNGQLDFPFNTFPHAAAFELTDRTEILRIDAAKTAIPPEFGAIPADIAVLTLESAAPSDIPRYSLHAGFNIVGRPIVITGYGNAGDGERGGLDDFDQVATKRSGLNRYEVLRNDEPYPGLGLLTYDFDSGKPEGNVLQTELDVSSDLGFGDDEVLAAHGDSGGPVFVNRAIAAVSAYGGRLDNRPNEAWGAFSFDVPVTAFREFIETSTSGSAQFIVPGDFDSDEKLTTSDIDRLGLAINANEVDAQFDINQDGIIDSNDRITWITDLALTWFGDADLNGEFNSSDFVAVFEAGQYEDSIMNNSSWATGDWNGDGEFTTADLGTAFVDGGYEIGPRTSSNAVPEVVPFQVWVLCLCVGLSKARRVLRM